jgi:hypothetical protein
MIRDSLRFVRARPLRASPVRYNILLCANALKEGRIWSCRDVLKKIVNSEKMTIIVSSNDVYQAFSSMSSTPVLVTIDAPIDRNLWWKVSSCKDDVHMRAYSLAFFLIL